MINIQPTVAQEREISCTAYAIRDGGGALLAWEPGCGKTYGAIWITQELPEACYSVVAGQYQNSHRPGSESAVSLYQGWARQY